MDINAAARLLGTVDRELWLVTAQSGAQRSGLIATFVGSASIIAEQPRMIVGLAKRHRTWDLVDVSGAFALHLLGPEHLEWVWRFGTMSGREVDKFAGLGACSGATGSPLLEAALGWLDCRVESRMDIGDRTIYLGAVVEAASRSNGPALTQKQLLQLAPADKMAEMKRQYDLDSAADAEAIRLWRQRGG